MKNFIEVTDTANTKVLVNITQIIRVNMVKDKKANCIINLPNHALYIIESYDEVLNLIEKSL